MILIGRHIYEYLTYKELRPGNAEIISQKMSEYPPLGKAIEAQKETTKKYRKRTN